MTQRIDVLLTGTDNLSSVLSKASTTGVMMGQAISGALGAVANSVGAAMSQMSGLVTQAADAQVTLIAASGSMQALMGGSFKDAQVYTEKLNSAFVAMGATLPGVTSDYADIGATIADDVGGAFKSLNGELDKVSFEKALLSLTRGTGVLAQAAKTSASEAAFAIQRVMTGDKNAFKLLFFDKNPVIKSQVEKFLASEGKTLEDWTELTTKDRIGILNKALDKAASPEMIQALSATAAGKYAEWETALKDPTSGLLGFMRKLEVRGGKTALDGLYALMQSSESLFKALAEKFPFKSDLMVGIFDVFSTISGYMDGASSALTAIPTLDASRLQEVGALIAQFVESTITSAGSAINSVISSSASLINSFTSTASDVIGRIDFAGFGASVGDALGGFLTHGMEYVKQAVGAINISSVIKNVSAIGLGIITALSEMVGELSSSLAEAFNDVTSLVISGAENADWQAIGTSAGQAFGEAVKGVVKAVVNLIGETNWLQVIQAVVSLAEGINEAFRAGMLALGKSMVSAAVSGIAQLASAIPNYIQTAFSQALASITGAATPTVTPIVSTTPTTSTTPATTTTTTTPTTSTTPVTPSNTTTPATPTTPLAPTTPVAPTTPAAANGSLEPLSKATGVSVPNLSSSLSKPVTAATGSLEPLSKATGVSVPNLSSSLSKPVTAVTGSLEPLSKATGVSVPNLSSSLSKPVTAVTGSLEPLSKATGVSIPNLSSSLSKPVTAVTGSLEPLLSAVRREEEVSGGRALIANSTETILNKTQTTNLVKGMGGFSPVINITAGGNTQEIANAVLSQIENLYRQYQLSM